LTARGRKLRVGDKRGPHVEASDYSISHASEDLAGGARD
jgi:hypothetical protein